MNQNHEYALLGGMNRAKVGRYISIASATISAIIMFVVLALWDAAQALGLPSNVPPALLSLVGAGMIFAVLYWFFDNHAWRWAPIGGWLKAPDLSGEWSCKGISLNPDGSIQFDWTGEMTISQSWDKIRVRLKTPTSGSHSIAAALLCDATDGYRLLYHYRNDPKTGQAALQAGLEPHRGFADLLFASNRLSAEGDYFNGAGRFTFGTMKLTKKVTDATGH